MKYLLSFVFLTLFISTVFAQDSDVKVEPVFIGSAPTAITLPAPQAGENGWGRAGTISVGIIVNELGVVSVTDDGEGPYPVCKNVTDAGVLSLRAAAVEAARNAKFSPLTIDGQPQMVSGRLNYKFGSGEIMAMPVLSSSGGITKLGSSDSNQGAMVVQEQRGSAAIVPPGGRPSTISGGVLNGKAVSLAKPAYPAAAKAVRAGGAVNVQVLIYEDGTMYTATAVAGHPLLRRASEVAACSSQFTPTLLQGTPVKVLGVITYNFVP